MTTTHKPNPSRYTLGDIIEYDRGKLILVDHWSPDIKNGLSGFTGILVNRDGVPVEAPSNLRYWGYDDEITRVIKRAPR